MINHNHHDSERLELCFGTGIWLFLDRENKISKRRKSVRIIVLLVLSGRLSNCRIFFSVLTGMEKKRKPYQQDSEAMELLLRFLDREQRAVHREHWSECSYATLSQSVEKQTDNLIYCQTITVSSKCKMHKKRNACAKWLFWLPFS